MSKLPAKYQFAAQDEQGASPAAKKSTPKKKAAKKEAPAESE